MPIRIESISTNLEVRESGVWFSRNQSDISYPEEASSWCFEVEQFSFWFQHRSSCISEVVKKFPPEGVIFDVGGGNGLVTKVFRDMGYESVLVEPSVRGVRNAMSRGISPIICSKLEDAGFLPQTLPAIGLFDVIEHIADDRSFLGIVHQLLAKKGRVYITVPSYKLLWSEEDKYAGHFRRYTSSSLRRVLASAGFQIEYMTYIFAILPLPIFLMRTLPYLLGLRRDVNIDREYREHRPLMGFLGVLINYIFETELSAIRSAKAIPFGSSILAVARA